MKEIPVCLNKSYRAFDELVSDICVASEKRNAISECECGCKADRSIKLMCDFWNIIREDPNFNLTEAVQQSIVLNEFESQTAISQGSKCMTCYMASCCPKSDGGSATCPRRGAQKSEDDSESEKKTCCQKREAEGKKSCQNSGGGTCSCKKKGAQMLQAVKSEPQRKPVCCQKREEEEKKSCCQKREEEEKKSAQVQEVKSEPQRKQICCQKEEEKKRPSSGGCSCSKKSGQKSETRISDKEKKVCCQKEEEKKSSQKSRGGSCSCKKGAQKSDTKLPEQEKKICCQKREEEEKKSSYQKPRGGSCACSQKKGSQKPEPRFAEPEKKGVCSRCGASKEKEHSNLPTICPSLTSGEYPLSTVLSNLKQAANFEEKCSDKLNKLQESEGELKEAIQNLEAREKESVKMLKEADCMWACMEDAYKQKLAESNERQKNLQKELKEVEASTKKWRKNMKDLESAIDKVDKSRSEIREKICQKNNDIKCLDMEIKDFQKRLENNKKEIEATKKSEGTKKESSDKKIAGYKQEIKTLERTVADEEKKKRQKEADGTKYIKEAREDLQKICGVLLKKKLENEDLKAERDALQAEIDLLLQARDKCKDKCDSKQKLLEKDIKKISKEIDDQRKKCGKCNQCTDTSEIQSFCTDCPKCLEDRRCAVEEDHCCVDHTMDCVCMTVKKKFLDNVFENMYTVLERQIKKGAGKGVADQVLECLKRSRNGKLDEKTRKSLQEFILTSVKKHLNLTIVGGAVKTRCEMDADMYKQLMSCLQTVQVSKPSKVDRGTLSKRDPCRRWGGTSECNCPKGPQGCICLKKAPPPPHDPSPCPLDEEDEDVILT
ncbi:axoneme-associated protein mst101(2)-like [Battus philenor]|uniref:axoneme-associated protein mst101(2)-like n=1 Tax=Battus philenor TaxID=42288 RepID=UPI0035CE9F91